MSEKSRILVVDDEQVVRLCMHRALASEHCKVETVVSGNAALEVLEQQPFDVVMLDLRMPGMNGMEVLKAIKQRWPEIEVIIVTGYAAVDTAKAAVAAGAWDYLAKPVGPDEIINAAQGALLHKKWAIRGERNTAHASQAAGH